MISFQEAFDAAYKGVINQGGVCRDAHTGTCCYRFEGKRCAIGHVLKGKIPETHSFWDCSNGIEELRNNVPEVAKLITSTAFFRKLQGIHDSFDTIGLFKSKMGELADTHGLEVPTL